VNDDWTTVEEMLSGLPRANSEASRSERVRARCHNTLSGSRRPGVPESGVRLPRLRRASESVAVGGFCAVYLCVLALIALRTHGVL
jgi:hypothetical protein